MESAKKMLAAFSSLGVKEAFGFVNGILVKNMADREEILRLWKQEGHKLGNHTYSHKDLAQVSAQDFIDDLESNESMLIDFVSTISELKTLRMPYLNEGESNEKRYAIRSYLSKRKYKTAQVSVDLEDWRWNEPYIRCKSTANHAALKELKERFIVHAVARLGFSEELSKVIYGRERRIKHILLIHLTEFTAEMAGEMLRAFLSLGARFVPAQLAIDDPVYREDSTYVGPRGKTFLLQNQESRKIKLTGLAQHQSPTKWLEGICGK